MIEFRQRAIYAILVAVLAACSPDAQPSGEDESGLRLVTPEGHTAELFSARFSPDSRWIVTASTDGTARLWETGTAREIRRFAGPQPGRDTAWVRSAAFSADGRFVVTGSRDSVARLWNIASGALLHELRGHAGAITSAEFSPDGRLVLTASMDRTARVWDVRARKVRPLVGHSGSLRSAAFSPDGQWIVTASDDGTARVWTARGALHRAIVHGAGEHPVFHATFSPDGRHVVSVARDGSTRIWEAANGRPLRWADRSAAVWRDASQEAGGFPVAVVFAAFSPDGRSIVTAGDDGRARIREVATGRELHELGRDTTERHAASLRSAVFSADGRSVLTASMDRTARLWNAQTGRLVRVFRGHARGANSVAFSPDGRLLVNASHDSSARVWEIATGREVARTGIDAGPVQSAVFSPDKKLLATASHQGAAALWDATSGTLSARVDIAPQIPGLKVWMWTSEFSPDGRTFVTASNDSLAHVWDTRTGAEVQLAHPLRHGGWVTSATFSPSGRYLVTTSYDSLVRIWNASDGTLTRRTTAVGGAGHSDVVWAAEFSPDEQRLVSASDDRTARVWDVSTGRELLRLRHDAPVRAAAFSPDGLLILTASHDRSARVWDAASGREVRQLRGHAGWVTSAAFSPDGRFIATTGSDGSTRVWNAATGAELFRRFALDSTDWVLVAPDGRFDGSEEGMRRLHYARGLRTISLQSFFEQFYTPGLAGLLLAGAAYDGPDIRRGFRLPPSVRIVPPSRAARADTMMRVIIEARDNGGGVADVRLYHNGSLVVGGEQARTGDRAKSPSKAFDRHEGYCPEGAACYAANIQLLQGMNEIAATAFSTDQTEAERAVINVVVDGDRPRGTLYVLSVGINSYRNPQYNLNYGRTDARAIAETLKGGAGSLFERVQVDTLFDTTATRARIIEALARIAAVATPRDVFVFFYAGHGTTVSVGAETRFFLVPTGVVQASDAAQLMREGISGADLRRWLEAIPARKKLMILDACQSGAAVEGFTNRGAAEERAIARLARSSGLFVMSATDSEQFASEVDELGHGLLTSALLMAMGGAGAAGDGEYRSVRDVMTLAERYTRELSVQYRREEQYPMMHSNGMDFPLVRPVASVPAAATRLSRGGAAAAGASAPRRSPDYCVAEPVVR